MDPSILLFALRKDKVGCNAPQNVLDLKYNTVIFELICLICLLIMAINMAQIIYLSFYDKT